MDIVKNLQELDWIYIVVVVAFAWGAIVFQQWLLPWVSEHFAGKRRLYILAAAPAIRLLIIVAAIFLLITHLMEPTLQNFIALLSAVGLALGFALKDYVSSQIAGIVTLFEIPYRVGDWVSIDGTYGEVQAINMRAVKVLTPDDTMVTIPHLKLWSSQIHNANDGSHKLLCAADFYLQPRQDGEKIRDALYDVALTSAYLQLGTPISVVAFCKPWGTHYRLKAYPIEPRDQFRFVTDLTLRGQALLLELGVELAIFPERSGGF